MTVSLMHVAIATAERNAGVDLGELLDRRDLRTHRNQLIRDLIAAGFSQRTIARQLRIGTQTVAAAKDAA